MKENDKTLQHHVVVFVIVLSPCQQREVKDSFFMPLSAHLNALVVFFSSTLMLITNLLKMQNKWSFQSGNNRHLKKMFNIPSSMNAEVLLKWKISHSCHAAPSGPIFVVYPALSWLNRALSTFRLSHRAAESSHLCISC